MEIEMYEKQRERRQTESGIHEYWGELGPGCSL